MLQARPKSVGRGAEYGVQIDTEPSQQTEMEKQPSTHLPEASSQASRSHAIERRTEPDTAGDLSVCYC